jgi:hypothetical protein
MNLFLWVVFALALLLVFGFAKMFVAQYNVGLWPAIRRARRELKGIARQRVPNAKVYTHQGATAISPGYLFFGIKTVTDEERDRLSQDPRIHEQFRAALVRAGYPTETIPVVHFGVQSQETVDRDFGGSWSLASQG